MVHFHQSLSRCSMGSLETCTHTISRPNTYYYSFLLPKLNNIIFIIFILSLTLGRYCKGLQTAHPHKIPAHFWQCASSFVHMKGYVTVWVPMQCWEDVEHKMFPSVLYRCGMGSLETCTHNSIAKTWCSNTSMSTLFFDTPKHPSGQYCKRTLIKLRLVIRQPARHFSALPIAIRNVKCHKCTQHNTTPKLNVFLTKEGKNYLHQKLFHFSSKALRQKKQHVISITFTPFSHKTTFTFKSDGYLLPGRMPLPSFLLGFPLVRWWRHLHHLRGWGHNNHLFLTTKAKDHQLKHNWHFNAFQNFKCNLLTILSYH